MIFHLVLNIDSRRHGSSSQKFSIRIIDFFSNIRCPEHKWLWSLVRYRELCCLHGVFEIARSFTSECVIVFNVYLYIFLWSDLSFNHDRFHVMVGCAELTSEVGFILIGLYFNKREKWHYFSTWPPELPAFRMPGETANVHDIFSPTFPSDKSRWLNILKWEHFL